jgi:hypothetical protein
LENLFSKKVKDKLFPDADFSSTTVFMELRGANQVTELYPKEFEQGCCQKKQKNDEYDMLTPDQIICIPSKRNANGSIDIIMSNREGKGFHHSEADDRIAWEATSHSLLAGQLFPSEELPRNCSRVDVLEWYIEIGKDQSQFGSLTAHTSVCNMWSLYIDRLKAEANKGKKKKWMNPILARCSSIINCLMTLYLNGGDNVGSHVSWPRMRARKNPLWLLPKSVFIESSINNSSKEIQFLQCLSSKYQNLKDVGTMKVR